jgi:transcriptional repressor NrdR
MFCPFCRNGDSRVLDSRVSDDGLSIRRRRQCPACGKRFTTMEQMQLSVVKKDGSTQPFNRDKVIAGVRKACEGRPVSDAQLTQLGAQVEEHLRATGSCEIPSQEVGVAILGPLAELDSVAYLRFASVYNNWQSVDDFYAEILRLRHPEQMAGTETQASTGDSRVPKLDKAPAAA